MESLEAYLQRKEEELRLLNGCLGTPLTLPALSSVAEVIGYKFRLAAALKAEHALHEWKLTETAWAQHGARRAGPFKFSYDYQRADLEVRGPSFYQFGQDTVPDTVYTSSGMAAISALLLASAQVMGSADILIPSGAYGETLELIEGYAQHLRVVGLEDALGSSGRRAAQKSILLIDSCTPAASFEQPLKCERPPVDLVLFDTTCFGTGSGRIRRVLRWARRAQLPVILVRSHTKLDSLGVEYGRLGSAVFLASGKPEQRRLLADLAAEMRNAVRLLGGAALPAHFPPYVGSPVYRSLTDRRIAAMLANGRRTARFFGSALARSAAELHFAHGLYVTLAPAGDLDEEEARTIADELCEDLGRAGVLLRHAGSFGFDFGAAEWFHDSASDRYAVRIAMPDLPTKLWDDAATAIAEWWVARQRQTAPRQRPQVSERDLV